MPENRILYILGEIKGELKGINKRLDTINGRMNNHDLKIDEIEAYQDKLKGKFSIIGIIAGTIGSVIGVAASYIFKRY